MADSDDSSTDGPDLSPNDDWNGLYLDGERDAGDRETMAVENPATGEPFAEVPAATVEDVDEAYEVAEAAQEEWAAQSPGKRASVVSTAAALLREHRDEILTLLATESGSSQTKGFAEFSTARGITQEAASFPTRVSGEHKPSNIPGKENVVKREPVGVVGVISPWNFPLHLSIRAVAPAVALGNAVVLKPASNTPITGGLLIARIFEAAGLPDGVLNVVTGRGSEIGDRVAGNPTSSVVAFTGSTEIGRDVAKRAVDHLAFPAMELGGNGPHVVLDDADVDRAVAAGTFGSFLHQGQVCISINRHLVHESIYDEYVDALVDTAESLAVGDPSDGDVIVGPVIDDGQRDQMLEYVAETVDAGATLETGGRALGPADIDGTSAAAVDLQDAGVSAADIGGGDADADAGGPTGRFVLPTVLSDATNDMAAACNEHFGPIAPVIPYADVDEAVELANDTEYGLAASVFGGDVARAESVADRVEAGMVHVNDQPINDEPHVMFGGTKASGIGRFNGEQVLEELTEAKWVSIQREPRRYPF